MKTLKTLAAASIIAASGSMAAAGGLSPVDSGPTVVPVPADTMAKGSVPSAYIVLGLVAALVALASDSDSSEATTTTD